MTERLTAQNYIESCTGTPWVSIKISELVAINYKILTLNFILIIIKFYFNFITWGFGVLGFRV